MCKRGMQRMNYEIPEERVCRCNHDDCENNLAATSTKDAVRVIETLILRLDHQQCRQIEQALIRRIRVINGQNIMQKMVSGNRIENSDFYTIYTKGDL